VPEGKKGGEQRRLWDVGMVTCEIVLASTREGKRKGEER